MKLMQMLIHKDLVVPFGCRRSHYDNSLWFANEVEQCGVIPTGIECLSSGLPGFQLELCSGAREYVVTLTRDRVKLTMSTPNTPAKHLGQGGAASPETWKKFAQAVKIMEDR